MQSGQTILTTTIINKWCNFQYLSDTFDATVYFVSKVEYNK